MKFHIQTSHVIFIVRRAINYPWDQQSVNKALATGWCVPSASQPIDGHKFSLLCINRSRLIQCSVYFGGSFHIMEKTNIAARLET